jgi:choline dehydrogenase-like flavoprotein
MRSDYVIVGGGTAGCVLARRLSEQRDRSVTVLEAGGAYPNGGHHIPLLSLLGLARYTRSIRTTQQAGLHHRQIDVPVGAVVGGSSAINAMIYVRGHKRCFDDWAAAGNDGWDFASVLPYFKKSEDFEDGDSDYHQAGGPIAVSRLRSVAPFSQAFIEAGREIGLPHRDDFNGAEQEGVGCYHVTQARGLRAGAQAYLDDAARRRNLNVVTGAEVHRVLFDKQRAIGVEFRSADGLQRVLAEREVIVCSGALHSPAVLLRSGVGPADDLRALGIEVVADVPGVGQGLQDHMRLPVRFHSTGKPPLDFPGSVGSAAWAYCQYRLTRRGPLTSNVCEAGAFVRTSRTCDRPDLQFVTHWPDPVDFEPCLIGTVSRGAVRLRSSDPQALPIVDPNYLAEPEDVAVLVEGIEMSRALARTRAMRDFGVVEEVSPGDEIRSRVAMERYVRTNATTSFHPVGTCKMAPAGDALGVVDSRLRVRGVSALRVVDASIMPQIVNGNTCAPTVMIAEYGADLIH